MNKEMKNIDINMLRGEGMNKVLLIGRLVRHCELRYLGENKKPMLSFTLAVQKPYLNSQGEREADFIPIVYWRKSAQAIAPYLNKGKLVSISGRVNVKSYEKENGKKKYVTHIIADQIQFISYEKSKTK